MTLNCNDGPTAHVEWVASRPGCQYDCTAHWICVNNSTENVNTYEDKVMVRLICLLYIFIVFCVGGSKGSTVL